MIAPTLRMLQPESAVLLVIDIQEKFLPVIHQVESLIANTKVMIEMAQNLHIPILVSEQNSRGLGHTEETLRKALPKTAFILEKMSFGCLKEATIQQALKGLQRPQVMVCGIEAHVCVNQTTHQLMEAGYQPHLITNAISARDPQNIALATQKMTQSGAIPSCTEMAIFELMSTAKHPQFKSLHALIK